MERYLKICPVIWDDVIRNKCSSEPEKQSLLLTDSALIPASQREKMATLLFEKYQPPSVLITGQSALCIYGAGLDHGMVLNVGANYTECVPVFEPENRVYGVDCRRTPVGGNDITLYLARLLKEKGHGLDEKAKDTVEKLNLVKESLCRVALDYAKESRAAASAAPRECKLPDGSVVSLQPAEALACAEALFQPEIAGVKETGVFDELYYTLQNSRTNARLKDVVVAGGPTLFAGFAERVAKELKESKPLKIFANRLVDVPDRKCLAWIGGAVVASTSAFQGNWVSRKEYAEVGPAIIHKKWLM